MFLLDDQVSKICSLQYSNIDFETISNFKSSFISMPADSKF